MTKQSFWLATDICSDTKNVGSKIPILEGRLVREDRGQNAIGLACSASHSCTEFDHSAAKTRLLNDWCPACAVTCYPDMPLTCGFAARWSVASVSRAIRVLKSVQQAGFPRVSAESHTDSAGAALFTRAESYKESSWVMSGHYESGVVGQPVIKNAGGKTPALGGRPFREDRGQYAIPRSLGSNLCVCAKSRAHGSETRYMYDFPRALSSRLARHSTLTCGFATCMPRRPAIPVAGAQQNRTYSESPHAFRCARARRAPGVLLARAWPLRRPRSSARIPYPAPERSVAHVYRA